MTMKSDFERILKTHGHDIFLQRKVNGIYSNSLEVHTVRYNSMYGALSKSQTEAEEGRVNTTEREYFFKAEALPFEGDRIYEQEPEAPTGQAIWYIDASVPLRGENGHIVYYSAGATRLQPN